MTNRWTEDLIAVNEQVGQVFVTLMQVIKSHNFDPGAVIGATTMIASAIYVESDETKETFLNLCKLAYESALATKEEK